MGDPIINTQVDAINTTLGNIKVDLAALRPSIRAIKDAIAETYLTDTIENVPIASFSDGADEIPVRELQVAIEPVQNLNGQTSPYPAGGGVNKFDVSSATSSNFSISGETFTNTLTDSKTSLALSIIAYNGSTIVATGGNVAGVYPDRTRGTITISSTVTKLRIKHNGSQRDLYFEIPWTAQGTFMVSCLCTSNDPTTVGGLVLTDFMITADGTYEPYAPYSNICPITGWSAANVVRVGKNFYNKDTGFSGIWAGNYGNEIISSTNAYSAIVPCAPNQQYRITKTSTSRFRVSYTTKYPEVGDPAVNVASNDSATSIQVTTGDNAQYLVIYCYYKPSDEGTISQADVAASIQVELGATATPYVVGQGTTATLSFGQTVYGGTLNVTTGVLTIDRACVTLNGSESISVKNTGTANWYYSFDTVLSSAEAKNTVDDISSDYPRTAIANGNTNQGFTSSGSWIRVRWGTEDTVANYKAWLANNPLQVCYKLATPTTVQLTAAEVTTLLGQNNVWCSSGNIIKLVYRVDYEHWLAEHTSA